MSWDRVDLEGIAPLVDLSGRAAVVTGGGRGIGLAIAQRLVSAGAHVTIADLDSATETQAKAVGASHVCCDVSRPDELGAAMDAASEGGRLDIAINNAAIFPVTGPIAAVDDDFVSRLLDLNLRAMFSAVREASGRMVDGGAIVNLASVAALRGGVDVSAYAASKAGVLALTRAAAQELGSQRIRVNAIAPGVIETPGVRTELAHLEAAGIEIEVLAMKNPLGRAGRPDDVARAALFLSSDLSDFVTGQTLVVDGGATL